MLNTLRTALLATAITATTGCMASGGFSTGSSLRAPPPTSQGTVEAGTEGGSSEGGSSEGGNSYGGPAGPMSGGERSADAGKLAEPRWDDFAFAVRERSDNYTSPWVISKLTTFKVGAACFAKLGEKDSGALNNSSYYVRNVVELAKKWTGDEWERVENQHSDRKRDRKFVEPMIDAFGQRFHMTIAIEGDDCDVETNTPWIRYWYTIGEAFAGYPPAAGKLFITLNVSAAARDVAVTVDESGTTFTITAPRDIEAKDWQDKMTKQFRKLAKNI